MLLMCKTLEHSKNVEVNETEMKHRHTQLAFYQSNMSFVDD